MPQTDIHAFEAILTSGTLVFVRVSMLVGFAPPLSSSGLPIRVKALLSAAMALLMTPIVPHTAAAALSIQAVLGEVGIGLLFALSVSFLAEAVQFAASLLSMNFSFSLANLLDPNSRVETPVIGVLLNWFVVLVLLAAGLHRVEIAAVLRTFVVVPPGSAVLQLASTNALVAMAGGIFLAGVQLAAPVMAAAIGADLAVALVPRVSPALPVQILSVPLKFMLSSLMFVSVLAIWPAWVERYFTQLLNHAEGVLR